MSETKIFATGMLVMAALSAFFLEAAPIESWERWVLAAIVAGIELGILVSAGANHYRHR